MPENTLDLKKTVNLPRTDFPMKANLPQNEPKILAQWDQTRLYDRIRKESAGRPMYVLHDGPPYANNRIHSGTAFNKVLKDFIVKSKTMAGFDSPYVPGWDCHGLPIEIRVDNELGPRKAKMTVSQIREECRKYALKWVDIQREDFRRLGVLGRWEKPYLTMTADYEAAIARAFVEFLDRGYVYKGLKPVNWCIRCRTALAEAEVEYENHTSPSVWVRFPLVSDPAKLDAALAGRRVYGLIWTTTPWTIPANMAIAFHPNYEYVAAEVDGDVYIVAADLLEQTAQQAALERAEDCGAHERGATGRRGLPPSLPGAGFGGRAGRLRHPRPGHRRRSHRARSRPGRLRHRPAVRHRHFLPGGRRRALLPGGRRRGYAAGSPHRQDGVGGQPGRHRHSEGKRRAASPSSRSSTATRTAGAATTPPSSAPPISGSSEWIATTCVPRALEAIRQVKWMPEWGEERISNMIAGRPDWCISRQRAWGVPIIVFYCEKCGEPLTDRKILDRVVELFERETADAWYNAQRRGTHADRVSPAAAAAARNSARKPTFSTCGSTRARATWPC